MALLVPEPEPAEPQGEDIPLNIVFEDAHLLVVDKPAGLVVHPAPGHESGTLVNALIAHCGDSLSGIGGVKKPGIVHRIDKDTSGLVVIAKTDAAHAGLSKLFEDHGRNLNLTRDYLAFVWGAPERAQGTVDAPIGRHATQRERMAVVSAARGREAITHWERLEDFGAASLLACRLETGRTHQIRVHMAHIGHPLIGDLTYGAGFKTKVARLSPEARAAVEGLGRQALHAATLGFTHPVTGEDLLFESDVAGGFGGFARGVGGASAPSRPPPQRERDSTEHLTRDHEARVRLSRDSGEGGRGPSTRLAHLQRPVAAPKRSSRCTRRERRWAARRSSATATSQTPKRSGQKRSIIG